jgi:hypothetical protein
MLVTITANNSVIGIVSPYFLRIVCALKDGQPS